MDIRKLQDKAKTSYTLSTRRLRFGYVMNSFPSFPHESTLPKMRHTQAATSTFQHFSKFDVRVLGEVLRTVQHQRIGNAIFLGVLYHITIEEAKVDNMDFRIVLHGKLGKGVAVGVFNKQELAALAAALDNGLCLVGVQKHGVLVAAGQVFPLVDAVRLILTVVVGHTSIYVLIRQQTQRQKAL